MHKIVLIELDDLLLDERLDVRQVFSLFFGASGGHTRLVQRQHFVALAGPARELPTSSLGAASQTIYA